MGKWTNKTQLRYMAAVEASHTYTRDRMKKLSSDAALEGTVTSNVYFLIGDALGEAYRAGVIDTLVGEK